MSVINTNVAAIKARSNLDRVQRDMDTSIARLSSGKRITRAADDAAGSAIAGRMESQIRGLNMSIRNIKDGQSLVDTQEGALQEYTSILQRMRELAVQVTSGVVSNDDKDYLQLEVSQLFDEMEAITANTKFNDKAVLTGATFSFYTDIDAAGTAITTANVSSKPSSLAISKVLISIGAETTGAASVAVMIGLIDSAIGSIASFRANLGATSNRFDHVIDNLTNIIANTEAAKSRVMDADFAIETTQLTRNTILQQAATSMVAQANSQKNSILALIQG
jgi:flagellin